MQYCTSRYLGGNLGGHEFFPPAAPPSVALQMFTYSIMYRGVPTVLRRKTC